MVRCRLLELARGRAGSGRFGGPWFGAQQPLLGWGSVERERRLLRERARRTPALLPARSGGLGEGVEVGGELVAGSRYWGVTLCTGGRLEIRKASLPASPPGGDALPYRNGGFPAVFADSVVVVSLTRVGGLG